jgi:hypothetical protein
MATPAQSGCSLSVEARLSDMALIIAAFPKRFGRAVEAALVATAARRSPARRVEWEGFDNRHLKELKQT